MITDKKKQQQQNNWLNTTFSFICVYFVAIELIFMQLDYRLI